MTTWEIVCTHALCFAIGYLIANLFPVDVDDVAEPTTREDDMPRGP